ncbi:MAG: DUF222 domain-containing protein [Candidatus Nanopelagicaceae bacterium]|nr:DUF222 domain-containing protein [Candidatus Nanopelagicaceae bacterium]
MSLTEILSTASTPIEARVAYIQTRPGSYENLGHLLEIEPRTLGASGRIDYLAALEKQYSWLYSLIQEATLAIAGSEPNEASNMWEGVDEAEREDVATALKLSPNTAQMRIDVARTLTNHLPATCEALSNGDISSSHATLIARETADALDRGVSPDILPFIESKALAHSEFHTAAQVSKKLKTLFAQYAPEVLEEKHEIARDTRTVSVYPEGDGMSTLIALLPSEDAQTVYLAINARIELERSHCISANPIGSERSDFNFGSNSDADADADADSGTNKTGTKNLNQTTVDTRNIEMKRADALTAIASEFLSSNSKKIENSKRPISINVTVDLPTLLGLAENPAELEGHGPIPASIARKLAADGKWRKFVTDPLTGNLLDMGRNHYLPSQYLVDFLTARDRTCRFPGCSHPARLSDIDHAKSWEEGGHTNPENLGFLCRRHHRLKTHGGWRLESHVDGSCTWTSPQGKELFVPSRPIDQNVAAKR